MIPLQTQAELAEELRRRDAILSALGRVAEQFLRAPRWQTAVPAMLEQLGVAVRASRAYLFRTLDCDPGCTRVDQLVEWVAPGISPQIENPDLLGLDLEAVGFGRWLTAFAAGEAIAGPTVTFPASERELLLAQDIRSLAVVPVFADERWWGFLGFDDCRTERSWTEAELDALRTAASTLGAALERSSAVEELRDSEERFRVLAAATLDGVLIHYQGEILVANARLGEVLGYAHDELIGRSAFELVTPEWRAELARSVAAERDVPYEVVALRADGGTLPVRLHAGSVHFGGRSVRVVVVHDRTEELRAAAAAERLIRETAARSEAEAAARRADFLAEASRVLGTSFDLHTTLAGLSRIAVPALADFCTVDLLDDGPTLQRVGVAHVDPELEAMLREFGGLQMEALAREHPMRRAALEGAPTLVPEISLAMLESVALDERHRDLLLRLSPTSSLTVPIAAAGRTLGVLTLCVTASARRYGPEDLAVAQELAGRAGLAIDNARLFHFAERATRDRDEMLAVVAHDLRNPLGTISMGSSLLLDLLPADADPLHRRQLQTIHRSAGRMNDLIQDLLDVSRIEAGRLKLETRAESVPALVAEAAELLRPLAEAQGLRWEAEVAPGLPRIQADASRLLQVISNLVGNAIKFTPAGGVIRFLAEPGEGEVCFAVSDTGRGIPDDQIPHLFSRFWQANAADRRGIGLGLSIAQGVVAAHGGRIWVTSQLNVGTTFRFTVPVPTPMPDPSAPPPGPEPAPELPLPEARTP